MCLSPRQERATPARLSPQYPIARLAEYAPVHPSLSAQNPAGKKRKALSLAHSFPRNPLPTAKQEHPEERGAHAHPEGWMHRGSSTAKLTQAQMQTKLRIIQK